MLSKDNVESEASYLCRLENVDTALGRGEQGAGFCIHSRQEWSTTKSEQNKMGICVFLIARAESMIFQSWKDPTLALAEHTRTRKHAHKHTHAPDVYVQQAMCTFW